MDVSRRSSGRVAARLVAAVLRTERALTLRAGVLSICAGLTEGAGALMLVPLLGSVGLPVSGGGVGRLAGAIRDVLGSLHVPVALGPVLLLYVAVVTMQALLTRAQLIASFSLEHRFVAALRKDLYAAVARAEWTFQRSLRRSDVLHVLINEIDRVGVATTQLLMMASSGVLTVIYVAIAARVSPAMTLAVVVAGTIVMLSLRGRLSRSGTRGETVSGLTRLLTAELTEHLAAMRMAKGLGAEERQIADVSLTADRLAAAQHDAVRLHAGSRTTIDIGGVIALALLLYLGLAWLRLDAGGVILLLYVFARLMPRLSALQQSAQHVAHYLPSYLSVEAALADAVAAREEAAEPGDESSLEGDISFDAVSFTYAGASGPAVSDLSVTIPARGFVALVGPSGSGKSTIADLLCGLVPPAAGRIAIGGLPRDAATRIAWRRSVAYVEQDAFVFNGTIRQNLEWVLPGASDATMLEALDQASAHFVREFPEGLSTELGDRGSRLSGGERQRIALARALLRKPRLLVLDEPTSALDSVNEARVLDAIEHLSGQVAIVLITHRLAAVQRAEMIYVIEEGRLVEGGDWGTLRARTAGRFKALWDAQHAEPAVSDTERLSVR